MVQRIIFMGLLMSLGTATMCWAQKFEKGLEKAEQAYYSGDYRKALKIYQKNKKVLKKKLSASNSYMVQNLIGEAKSEISLGNALVIPDLVTRAYEMSELVNENNPVYHAQTCIEIAEVWFEYGHILKSLQYLDYASGILRSAEYQDNRLKARLDIDYARCYTAQGYYKTSLESIEKQIEYLSGRAVKKETIVDPTTGTIETRKLDKDEYTRRFQDYADILTLKAITLNKMGRFESSDSAFQYADNWIDNNLGKGDLKYLENTFYWAEMLEDNGVVGLPIKYYEKVNSNITRDARPTHILNTKVQNRLIRAYQRVGDITKMKRQIVAFENLIKKYFGKENIHFIRFDALELDVRLAENKTRDLERKASKIVSKSNTFLPEDHPLRLEINEFLYDANIVNSNLAAAEANMKEILNIKEQIYGTESPEYAFSQVDYARYLFQFKDQINLAEEMYNKYFFENIKKETTYGHVKYLKILNTLAELYVIQDRYNEAASLLDEALLAARKKYDNKDIDYAKELISIANLQINIGEYDKAENNIKDAIQIYEEKKNKNKVAQWSAAYETQARLLAIQALYDEAENALDKSQKLAGKADILTASLSSSSSVEELASLYIDIGKYTETKKLLDEGIAEFEDRFGVNSRKLIKPLSEQSRLFLVIGDYTDAEKVARRAVEISSNVYGDESSKTADALFQLGLVYTAIGDYEKAQDNIMNTVKIREKQFGKNHVDYAKAISQLALIKYYKQDNAKNIEPLLLEARKVISDKLGLQSPLLAETLKNLAALYIRQGRTDEAFNLLDQSQRIWEARLGRRNNINLAGIFVLKGDLYYFQFNYEKAQEMYNDARKVYRKVFNDKHPNYVKVISKMSKVAYMRGDKKESKRLIDEALLNYNQFIKEFFPALSEREKAKFWSTIKGDFEFYNTLAFELQKSDAKILESVYDNAITTKAILLNSSIKMRQRIINSNDEELKKDFAEWIRMKELLTTVISMSEEQLEKNNIDRVAIEQEVEYLEKQLSEKSELFAQSFDNEQITWENIKESLRTNEVALEMIRFRHFDHVFTDSVVYALLFLQNDKRAEPEAVLLANGHELETKYLGNYRNSIKFRLKDRFSYEQYWQPIAEKVGESATIYLSADGVYNQINLEAIPIDDNSYVLDNSNIVLISNTKDIYLKRKKAASPEKDNRAILFGNPDFYVSADETVTKTVTDLPGTEKEIEELKELLAEKDYKIKDYVSSEAKEENIKEVDSPKIFHIATHGFFTSNKELEENLENLELDENYPVENPLLRTGLLLTGAGDLLHKTNYNYNAESGILTAYEAMNLNLDYTDLVVLSACETGLGDLQIGEGVYGLQRAFLVAGAKNLIMSLFKVSDEATQKLMVKFYRKWLETGNKRQSFIDAKKEIRTEYKDPIYWGPFIMMGMDE